MTRHPALVSLLAAPLLCSACATAAPRPPSGPSGQAEAAAGECPPPLGQAASPYRNLDTLEPGEIVHLATGRSLTEAEALAFLAPFPVVYVGESHDSVEDHQVQLKILEALEAQGGRAALGLEMLSRDFQPQVDAWVAGELDEKAFAQVWEEAWSPHSWPYYRDLLLFARDHHLPVVALNAEKALVDAVRTGGLEGLDEPMRARLPELDLDDPYHRASAEGVFSGHGHGGAMIDRFLAIQALWDETMAETAAAFLEGPVGQDRQLLILAGGFHVRHGIGIPRRLFRRVPRAYAIVEPWAAVVTEEKQDDLMDVDLPDLPLPYADLIWGVTYRDLADQRGVLGLVVQPGEAGLEVESVVPGGPAAEAGVQAGDVLRSVDGEPVKTLFDLSWLASRRPPGSAGRLRLEREGEAREVEFQWGRARDLSQHGAPEEAPAPAP